jgi:hypothetical protein
MRYVSPPSDNSIIAIFKKLQFRDGVTLNSIVYLFNLYVMPRLRARKCGFFLRLICKQWFKYNHDNLGKYTYSCSRKWLVLCRGR